MVRARRRDNTTLPSYGQGANEVCALSMAGIGHVFTITRVAEILGEDEDWLHEICSEMDPEDGRLSERYACPVCSLANIPSRSESCHS
jgi:hypothetical protein